MYINPSFRPYDPHLHHLAFGECERSLGVRAYLFFCEERGSSFKFISFFHFIEVFQGRKLFQFWKLKIFTHFHFLSQLKLLFFQTSKLFIHRTPIRPTNQLWIAFTHFHPNLMKDISFFDRNMFLHDPTWKFQLVDSCSKFEFFGRKFTSAHEIGCLAYMTCLSVLASAQLIFTWKAVIMYKTY